MRCSYVTTLATIILQVSVQHCPASSCLTIRPERMVGQLWSDAGKKIDEFVKALNALRRDMSSILELEATLVLHDVKFVSSRTLKEA